MNMLRIFTLLVTCLFATTGQAQFLIRGIGSGAASNGTYTGPGNVVGAIFWWGLRAYNTAGAGTAKLVQLQRASDSQTCDIIASVTGGFGNTANCSGAANGQTAAVFCNATICSVMRLYEQTGNLACTATACDYAQTGAPPVLTLNCIGSQPCMTFNGTTQELRTGNNSGSAQAQPLTIVSASRTNAGSGNQTTFGISSAQVQTGYNVPTGFFFFAGSEVFPATPLIVLGTWYARQDLFNGASSAGFINGAATAAPGNPGAVGLTTGTILTLGSSSSANFLNGPIVEGGVWAGAFSGPQQTSMDNNIRSYWGF